MSFAAPLGVGLCSVGEYMDVEIASSDGAEDFKKRLQEACPYGIDILSVKMLPEKAGNAMASVAAATYAVAFKDPEKSFAGCQGAVDGLLSKKELWITKETKRSTAEVDIRSGIYDCHIDDGALVFMVDANLDEYGNERRAFLCSAGCDRRSILSSVCVITRAVLKEHTEPVLTSFYLEKDKLTEVHPHLEGRSLLGNIYVGKVKHVVKNIDAAFV